MCGIIYIDNWDGKRASKSLLKRYQKQSRRGTEGYGCIAVKNNTIQDIFRSTDEKGIRQKIYDTDANMFLFHHRKPTSTPNIVECTHPIYINHKDFDFDYLVVHNGVIHNAGNLRTEFEKQGFFYNTVVEKLFKVKGKEEYYVDGEQFNDSESFAIDICLAIENNLTNIKSTGTIAFVVMQFDKENGKIANIFFGRNYSNPLKLNMGHNRLILASEGDGSDIVPNQIHCYDIETRSITGKYVTMGYQAPPTTTTPVGMPAALPFPKNEKLLPEEKSKTLYNLDKSFLKVIKFKEFSGRLYKTNIPTTCLDYIYNEEWKEYEESMKEIEDAIDIRLSISKTGKELSEKERLILNEQLKISHMELRAWSDKIMARVENLSKYLNKGENKNLM